MVIKSVVVMKPCVIIALPAYVSVFKFNQTVHLARTVYSSRHLYKISYFEYEINFCCIIYITSFK